MLVQCVISFVRDSVEIIEEKVRLTGWFDGESKPLTAYSTWNNIVVKYAPLTQNNNFFSGLP